MIDWDDLQIAVVDPDTYIITSDENIYTIDAEQRMVTFTGAEGPAGPAGPAGRSGTITVGTVTTLPAGSDATVENVGTNTDAVFDFGIPRGESGSGGASMWGEITGTLSDQTDLQTALNAKANTADLGDLATQDTVDYATEVTNKPTLGDLSALDSIDYTSAYLTNKPTLGALASKDTADYATDLTNKPTLGALAGMDSISYSSNYLTDKPTLGTMASVNDAPSDNTEYARKNGQWVISSGGGGGGGGVWGAITGTLSNQTDLQTALDTKADVTDITLNVFSESVSYNYGQLVIYQSLLYRFIDNHTAGPWDSSDVSRITVSDLLNLKADIQSPALTGTPTAPTPTTGDSSTKIATTAYVQGEISGKQNTLTFDSTPTASSSNPVTSGGIYTALADKANTADLGDLASLNSVNVAKGGTGRSSLTSNAILAGNGTGNVKLISTASGALYATQSGGAASFGALPTAQGGTGGTDTGWESKTGDNFNGTIYYRKVGVFVAICAYQIKLKADLTGSSVTLLDSNSLPVPVVALSYPAGNNQGFGQIMVTASGGLTFYKEAGNSWLSTRNINFSGMYMTS